MGDTEESKTNEVEACLNDCQAENTAVPANKAADETTQNICAPGPDKEQSETSAGTCETEISKEEAQKDNGRDASKPEEQSNEATPEATTLGAEKAEDEGESHSKETEVSCNDDEVAQESPIQSTESHEIPSTQLEGGDIEDGEKEEEQSQPKAKAEATGSSAQVESSVTDEASNNSSSKEANREKKKPDRTAELPRSRTMPKSYGRASKKDIAEKFGGVATSTRVQRSTSYGANSVKSMLLEWCRAKTRGREGVDIQNFSSSWSSGLAFCALISAHFPDAFDYDSLDPKNRRHNFQLAFSTAETLADCPPLLDVEDMVHMKVPDSKCVYTYVQELYRSLVAKGLVKTKKA